MSEAELRVADATYDWADERIVIVPVMSKQFSIIGISLRPGNTLVMGMTSRTRHHERYGLLVSLTTWVVWIDARISIGRRKHQAGRESLDLQQH